MDRDPELPPLTVLRSPWVETGDSFCGIPLEGRVLCRNRDRRGGRGPTPLGRTPSSTPPPSPGQGGYPARSLDTVRDLMGPPENSGLPGLKACLLGAHGGRRRRSVSSPVTPLPTSPLSPVPPTEGLRGTSRGRTPDLCASGTRRRCASPSGSGVGWHVRTSSCLTCPGSRRKSPHQRAGRQGCSKYCGFEVPTGGCVVVFPSFFGKTRGARPSRPLRVGTRGGPRAFHPVSTLRPGRRSLGPSGPLGRRGRSPTLGPTHGTG